MTNAARLAASACFALCLPLAALAQDAKPQPAPAAPAPAAPAMAEPATGNPNLSVATVKMDGGMRASKFIGASVTGGGQDLGTINDLVLDKEGHAILGVISVGAVLGVGGKLVAVPYASLQMGPDGKVSLQDGSKDGLAKMPGFTYTQ